MDVGGRSYAEYYDEMAKASAWHGPAVIFGLLYPYIQAGESILDIGVGTGLGSILFARAGLRVFGMDSSSEMLDGARSKGFAQDLRQHDMTSAPYPYACGSFDHAICVGVLQFFTGLDRTFGEVGRVLRDGGVFGFTVVDRRDGEGASFRAGGAHTEQERDLTMFRHTESAVHASLDVGGLRVCADLEFVAYMDAARTAPMSMRAYVARREPRI